MGYSRLLRKVAERVLRDITIIIFRRFSESSSLHLLREQHMHNHKITGMQVKRQRSMRISSGVKGDEEALRRSGGQQGSSELSSGQQGSLESASPKESTSPIQPTPTQSTPTTHTPQPHTPSTQPGWDAAALRIITFLSSRINPNVPLRRR